MRLGCPDLTSDTALNRLAFLLTTVWNKHLYSDNIDDLRKVLDDLKKSKAYISELEAELKVRPNPRPFPPVPKIYRHKGANSAFACGFVAGWKSNEFNPTLYTRSDCRRAYECGYRDGAEQAEEKILALKSEVK